MRSTSWRSLVRLSVLLGCVLLAAGAASAAILTVTSVADDLTAGDGLCTLREAILNANGDTDTSGGDCAAGTGADEIFLPAGIYLLSIPGAGEDGSASGDLDVAGELTITGARKQTTVIDAAGLDRVLHVLDSATSVSLIHITLTGGQLLDSVSQGGGVLHQAGALTIANSAVSFNTAVGGGGGIASVASCITPGCSTLLLSRTAVSDNTDEGIFFGGGILLDGVDGSTPEATLVDSTVSGNTALSAGAVIVYSPGTLMVTNSTISGNEASSGGTLLLEGGSSLTLTNSTVANNGTEAFCGKGGCIKIHSFNGDPFVTFVNSILANAQCSLEIRSIVASGGHNIGSGFPCGLTDPTDLPNTDPILGLLRPNGGLTQTHALRVGSPAIDAIASGACFLTTDQRGRLRPVNGDGVGPALCDIGAYERARPGRRCGVGFELTLLLAPLGWLSARRGRI